MRDSSIVPASTMRTIYWFRMSSLRLHDHPQTGGSVRLSPYDLANLGRAIPMVFFYEATLDPHLLLNALEKTLVLYPAFCGRYDATPPAVARALRLGVGARRPRHGRGLAVEVLRERRVVLRVGGRVRRAAARSCARRRRRAAELLGHGQRGARERAEVVLGSGQGELRGRGAALLVRRINYDGSS